MPSQSSMSSDGVSLDVTLCVIPRSVGTGSGRAHWTLFESDWSQVNIGSRTEVRNASHRWIIDLDLQECVECDYVTGRVVRALSSMCCFVLTGNRC